MSIVETLEGREDKDEDHRSPNGTIRKKLYFNPAYFEPHLLVVRFSNKLLTKHLCILYRRFD